MLNKSFDSQIWSGFRIGEISQYKLDEITHAEYSRLNEYSELLIRDHFKNVNTKLDNIKRSRNGYSVYRFNSKNKWIVKINIACYLTEIKRSI